MIRNSLDLPEVRHPLLLLPQLFLKLRLLLAGRHLTRTWHETRRSTGPPVLLGVAASGADGAQSVPGALREERVF